MESYQEEQMNCLLSSAVTKRHILKCHAVKIYSGSLNDTLQTCLGTEKSSPVLVPHYWVALIKRWGSAGLVQSESHTPQDKISLAVKTFLLILQLRQYSVFASTAELRSVLLRGNGETYTKHEYASQIFHIALGLPSKLLSWESPCL